MTISNYRAKSATIATLAYPGLIDFSIEQAGDAADMRSDGQIYRPFTPVIKIEERITITLKNAKSLPAIGTTGAVVLASVSDTGGLSHGADLTCTAASATVLSVSPNVGADSASTNVTLQVNAGASDASGIVWAGG